MQLRHHEDQQMMLDESVSLLCQVADVADRCARARAQLSDLALAVADLQSKADEAELQSLQTAGTSAEAKALVTRLRREGRSSEAEAAAAELRASLVRAHSAVSEGLRFSSRSPSF